MPENETAASQPPQQPTNPQPKKKKEKKIPEGLVIPPKKAKLTKAERRALQEKQRAEKEANGGSKKKKGGKPQQQKGGDKSGGAASGDAQGKKDTKGGKSVAGEGMKEQSAGATSGSNVDKTLNFFSHLPPAHSQANYRNEFSGIKLGSKTSSRLHPAVLHLGQQYASGSLRGANKRCRAMLQTFKILLEEYVPPPPSTTSHRKDYRHDLEQSILKPAFTYWTEHCRTHSTSMGNAFTFLKLAVANLDRDMEVEEAKVVLMEVIDAYIQERIEVAHQAICKHASTKIVDGDVILTYASSEVIGKLLQYAMGGEDELGKKKKKSFRVIVVDSRPLLEGRDLLEKLLDAGIDCSYIFLNALSYVMTNEVTKVFLGAAALMSDGSIMSRVGTASIANVAKANNIPVLFCCETYKINNRVQLESITVNELGDPDDLETNRCAISRSGEEVDAANKSSVLKNWRDTPNLTLVSLLYDLTPSEFVSGIVTEMGILPPTSVAVLLREMNPQENNEGF